MRKLAKWFRKRGMPILGDAFSVWVTGGKAAVPKVIKQVTKTLGLDPNAKESEILRHLTGSTALEQKIAELEASLDSQVVAADLDAYLMELDFDKTRIIESGKTWRAELQTKDTFITHVRPTGLYLSYKWITGFLIFFAFVAVVSFWMQYRLLQACINSVNVAECVAAVRTAKDALPLALFTTAIAAISTAIWMAILAPLYSYFPLRSADKWIRSKIGAPAHVDHGDLIRPITQQTQPLPQQRREGRRNYDDE